MYLWSITIEEYEIVLKLAIANGKKPGDSIEEEFFYIMELLGKKPSCATDKNITELLKEAQEKGLNAIEFHKLVEEYKRRKNERPEKNKENS